MIHLGARMQDETSSWSRWKKWHRTLGQPSNKPKLKLDQRKDLRTQRIEAMQKENQS